MSAKPDKIDWDKPVHMTEAEYLEFEQNSEERHEFDDGVVRPLSRLIGMAGGTIRHSRAGSRLIRHIGNALESSSCEVFGPDQAVKARNDPRYSYPDVSIVCGEIEGDPVNPSLFINNPI
jgi:Uma2 family endonuclease